MDDRTTAPRRRAVAGVVALVAVLASAGLGLRAWQGSQLHETERAVRAPCPPFEGGPPLPPPPAEPVARLAPLVPSGASLANLAHHPAGGGFLGDRFGRIWSYPDGLADPPVLDLTGRIHAEHDQGLLGVAVSPDGGHLYAHFNDLEGDTELVAWRLVDGRPDPGSERLVLFLDQRPKPHHKGGSVVFGPDGLLYLALGDGGATGDRYDDAQRLGSLRGKVLRIDPTPEAEEPYRVPADNPFVGVEGARPEIYAYGLRNPFRISLDGTGALWIGDVGNTCVEEVSVLPVGATDRNLGWNRLEGTRQFVGEVPDDHVPPVVAYPHGGEWCAVVGGVVYRGQALEGLAGWYVFGDLCSGRLLALSPERDELRDLGVEVRQLVAIVERPDHELDVLSLVSGVSALLAPGQLDPPVLPSPVVQVGGVSPVSDRDGPGTDGPDGVEVFATHCAACHGEDGSGGAGPSLRDGRTVEVYPDVADQVRVVETGRRAMPSFEGRLTPAEIDAVVAYVRHDL